ncbi:MAG: glutathione synthase [Gammaproteobacteria bacterium]
MTVKIAVIMDPIESIQPYKDSTFAMLLEAQRRSWSIHYIRPNSLYVLDGRPFAQATSLSVQDLPQDWFKLGDYTDTELSEFNVILMRKDPPFNMEYIYTTYVLELAQQAGACVVNNPSALRNLNEKFSILDYPNICTPTLVTRDRDRINLFINTHNDVVVKPLDAMGGESIFKVSPNDSNKNSIIDQITDKGATTIMAQRFIPEISQGDKRILIVNGEPIDYAFARIPASGEFRGNLAAGGSGHGIPLSNKDRQICTEIKTTLVDNGILFAGIDVIGSYLTEINITSPTCIRELDSQFNLNISGILFDQIETLLD